MLEVITSLGALEAIRAEWGELWLSDSRATPFQSPEWLLPWTRHLFGGGQIWTLAARRGGKLVSLLPLFRWGPGQENLSFLGAGVTDYLDCIGENPPAIPGDWTEARLEELRSDSPLLARGAPEECSRCPVVRLPECFEELVSRLDPKVRTDLRRNRSRLERAGAVQIHRTANLDALFRLHGARWRSQNESGVLSTESIRALHDEAAAGFEALGMLRLFELTLNGEAAAVIYALAHAGRWYGYLNGFDPALAKLSPGSVLLAHVMEQAINEGAREFDFLRGEEAYKYAWTAEPRSNFRLRLSKGKP